MRGKDWQVDGQRVAVDFGEGGEDSTLFSLLQQHFSPVRIGSFSAEFLGCGFYFTRYNSIESSERCPLIFQNHLPALRILTEKTSLFAMGLPFVPRSLALDFETGCLGFAEAIGDPKEVNWFFKLAGEHKSNGVRPVFPEDEALLKEMLADRKACLDFETRRRIRRIAFPKREAEGLQVQEKMPENPENHRGNRDIEGRELFAQRAIVPLLSGGRKLDFRVFVGVLSLDPAVLVWKFGFGRTARAKFSAGSFDPESHLTNTARGGRGVLGSQESGQVLEGYGLSMELFAKRMDKVVDGLARVLEERTRQAKERFGKRKEGDREQRSRSFSEEKEEELLYLSDCNGFEVLAADVIMNPEGELYLLELNASPDFVAKDRKKFEIYRPIFETLADFLKRKARFVNASAGGAEGVLSASCEFNRRERERLRLVES